MPSPNDTLREDPLHLVGCFDNPFAGAEIELIDLARLMQQRYPDRPVALWSTKPVHARFAAVDITVIKPFGGAYPKGGAILLSGVHVDPGIWMQHAKPRKIRVRYNLPNHERLCIVIEQIRAAISMEPELVFSSAALRWTCGMKGEVEPSLIPMDRYLANPLRGASEITNSEVKRPLTIGRVSRDVLEKHHEKDPMLYRMLAARGVRVRLMGATCLASQLKGVEGVELLPAGAEDVDVFHRSLDVFFYRTGTFSEPYGRVVFEAMASGLPVVGSRYGGYAEFIAEGGGAIVFETQEQAYDSIVALQSDPAALALMGQRARDRAVALHGQQAIDAMLADYASF